jgi:formamidopyrimidine-DNA glycosylase
MPEWPEMEHYRQQLEVRLIHKRITAVHIERERCLNISAFEFTNRVIGHHITAVQRRAKMLLFKLDSKDVLLLHLMLGGWIYVGTEQEKPKRTIQVQLSFGEQQLYLIGLRLGYLHLFHQDELVDRLADIGPEPFDPSLSFPAFRALLQHRRGTLKKYLTDQSIIGGIGNCYSDEICYAAGLLPSRLPSTLSDQEWRSLYDSMHKTLHDALRIGGYMEHALYAGDVSTGQYNEQCKVYDREGERCLRCGHDIIRSEVSNKKSFHCPGCQR